MSSEVSMTAGIGRFPRGGLGRRAARLRAWTRRSRLDAMLAEGCDPWGSAQLTWRAAQLSSLGRRRKLASGLEDVVADAERGGTASAGLRIRRREVLQQREPLMGLAARLRAPAPVPVAVVARLAELLCSGSSPIYVGGRPPELLAATATQCLDALVGPAARDG
jgi:hypothetical protein